MKQSEARALLSTPMPPEPKKPRQKDLLSFGPYMVAHAEWTDLLHQKLAALCQREGITWNDGAPDWRQLALRLAGLHEPGFHWIGAPKSKDTVIAITARRNLLRIVERLATATGKSSTAICVDLAKPSQRRKLPRFYAERTKPMSARTLRDEVKLAKRERLEEQAEAEAKRRRHPLLRRRKGLWGLL